MSPPEVDTFPLEQVRFLASGIFGVDMLQKVSWRSRLNAIEFEQGSVYFRRFFTLGLDRLERLAFLQEAINPAEVRELIVSPLFRQLTSLRIVRAPVGGAVAQAIVREGVATGLRELHLVNTRIPPHRLDQLLDTPAASDLDALSLGGDGIGAPEKFRVLARASRLAGLRSLDMSGDAPKESGLEAFLASPMIATLQKLDLSDCGLNRDRIRLLASGAFGELRVLRLNRNPVGNDGTAAIARSPHLTGLLGLELSYSQVGDEGIEAILESPLADGLVLLNLTGSPASDETKELLKARMGDRVRI